MAPTNWCRSYTVCTAKQCTNWIWDDKKNPGTRCRRCGTWWSQGSAPTGKGKGQGHGQGKKSSSNIAWTKSSSTDAHLEPPPGLHKLKPLKKTKNQQTAAELLATTWDVIPNEIQTKLAALGLAPPTPAEPGLTELLQTHLNALPQPVQDIVNKLSQPMPATEKDLAQQLKTQVTELKTISMKKAQLQVKLDQTKSQYAAMLQDMQEHQARLTDGQQKLKTLSEKYMQAVNKTPLPEGLATAAEAELPIPMAVETFVNSLGVTLTEDQRSQLQGLLKRPGQDAEDPSKRRKTEVIVPAESPGHCG